VITGNKQENDGHAVLAVIADDVLLLLRVGIRKLHGPEKEPSIPMNLALATVPEMTPSAPPAPTGPSVPTIGELARAVSELAVDPGRWCHLVRFDRDRPVSVDPRAGTPDGIGIRLTTWPPGYRSAPDEHDAVTRVVMVLAGELEEHTISSAGAAMRPLRPNRVRVHGRGHVHELFNPGPTYAIVVRAYA
jgi:hypothetical protein